MPMETDGLEIEYQHFHIGTGKITNMDLEKKLFSAFQKASTIPHKEIYVLDKEKIMDYDIEKYFSGLKNFKRKTLGIFNRYSMKFHSDIEQIVIGLGIADSRSEAKDLLLSMSTHELKYNRNNCLILTYTNYGCGIHLKNI